MLLTSTLKATVLIGCLLTIALPTAGQEKVLIVRANFSHEQLSTMPASVSRTEVNRVLAKRGYIVEDKVYSQNGRIEARIEPAQQQLRNQAASAPLGLSKRRFATGNTARYSLSSLPKVMRTLWASA
jgi:hypothetical protein